MLGRICGSHAGHQPACSLRASRRSWDGSLLHCKPHRALAAVALADNHGNQGEAEADASDFCSLERQKSFVVVCHRLLEQIKTQHLDLRLGGY